MAVNVSSDWEQWSEDGRPGSGTATMEPGPAGIPAVEDGSCDSGSLTGSLSLFVQALLAFIAFSALIVKRFCEPRHERRPWIIWFFDTSKQAIGATVIHFSNVFLSEIFHGDPCTWYVISFLLDSTLGLLIICIGLKASLMIIKYKQYKRLVFGQYGDPARCSAWLGQCLIYVVVVLVEKLLMTLLILFDFWKKVRWFILYPVTNAQLRLVIVMFIIPLFVNALVFWVVDNYLKQNQRKLRLAAGRQFAIDLSPPLRSASSSGRKSSYINATGFFSSSSLHTGGAGRGGGGKYSQVRWSPEDVGSSDVDTLLSMEEEDTGVDLIRSTKMGTAKSTN